MYPLFLEIFSDPLFPGDDRRTFPPFLIRPECVRRTHIVVISKETSAASTVIIFSLFFSWKWFFPSALPRRWPLVQSRLFSFLPRFLIFFAWASLGSKLSFLRYRKLTQHVAWILLWILVLWAPLSPAVRWDFWATSSSLKSEALHGSEMCVSTDYG